MSEEGGWCSELNWSPIASRKPQHELRSHMPWIRWKVTHSSTHRMLWYLITVMTHDHDPKWLPVYNVMSESILSNLDFCRYGSVGGQRRVLWQCVQNNSASLLHQRRCRWAWDCLCSSLLFFAASDWSVALGLPFADFFTEVMDIALSKLWDLQTLGLWF